MNAIDRHDVTRTIMIKSLLKLALLLSIVSPTATFADDSLSLKDNVLDYSQLAQNLDAFLFVSGISNGATSSIIVLEAERLGQEEDPTSSKCDIQTDGSLQHFSGLNKKIRRYKTIKDLVKKQDLEFVYLVTIVAINSAQVSFNCLFSSDSRVLKSSLLPEAESRLLNRLNAANQPSKVIANDATFKVPAEDTNFLNSDIVSLTDFIKDDFETSREFIARKQKALEGMNPYTYYSVLDKVSYDADSGLVLFNSWGGLDGTLIVNRLKYSTYSGSNAFGASRDITERTGNIWRLDYNRAPTLTRSGVRLPRELIRGNLESLVAVLEIEITPQEPSRENVFQIPTYSDPTRYDYDVITYSGLVKGLKVGNKNTEETYLSRIFPSSNYDCPNEPLSVDPCLVSYQIIMGPVDVFIVSDFRIPTSIGKLLPLRELEKKFATGLSFYAVQILTNHN